MENFESGDFISDLYVRSTAGACVQSTPIDNVVFHSIVSYGTENSWTDSRLWDPSVFSII